MVAKAACPASLRPSQPPHIARASCGESRIVQTPQRKAGFPMGLIGPVACTVRLRTASGSQNAEQVKSINADPPANSNPMRHMRLSNCKCFWSRSNPPAARILTIGKAPRRSRMSGRGPPLNGERTAAQSMATIATRAISPDIVQRARLMASLLGQCGRRNRQF
jgi:hypothetical protein